MIIGHQLNQNEPHTLEGSSNRSFGIIFAALFTIIGLFPLLGGGGLRYWSLATAGIILTVALIKAKWLAPFNKIWFKIGLLLHSIASPVVMAALFYAVITPTGLIMRALGKDLLHLQRDRNAKSYWIHCPKDENDSMKNQF